MSFVWGPRAGIIRKIVILEIVRSDLGSGGLQSIGNGCGLQLDGFSALFDSSESIFHDFPDVGDFAFVSVV